MHIRKTVPTGLFAACLITFGWPATADDVSALSEPGTAAEPVRLDDIARPDLRFHDGGLPPVVGAHNVQVMRANRTHADAEGADGLGWTYNHAPMLCYWNGRFYLEYLTDPVGEHVPPGQTMLVDSPDGYRWTRPRVAFPPFTPEGGEQTTVSHQRMGFYVAPNGRLLILGFYGRPPRPNNGEGVGRAVREIRQDGRLGPIHFIRYNRHAGFSETNTPYPFYRDARDEGFVTACDALLTNKLMTQQWWEEDRSDDGFYAIEGSTNGFDAKALSFYHRRDGAVVGLWKKRWTALSFDEGRSWTEPVRLPTLVTGSAKTWGQRTDDGRYVLAFDPHPSSRWPLVVVTGEDGITFGNMLVAHGEIPYPRYDGQYKSLGPQYVRGIAEGNGNPPGETLWLTYSVNKEDIWVTRLPLPIRGTVSEPVRDTFDQQPTGLPVHGWNVYSPRWAPVCVAPSPETTDGHSLELRDTDRYDYAKALRVFPRSTRATVKFRIRPERVQADGFEVELLDREGHRPVRLILNAEGVLRAWTGFREADLAPVSLGEWQEIELGVDTTSNEYTVTLNGTTVLEKGAFAEPAAGGVERLCFRTGPYRDYDAHAADLLIDESKLGDRLDGDVPQPMTLIYVDDVSISPQ